MPHILLVDDDDLFRKMLRLTLLKMGHKVTEACNGKEAILAHKHEPADVVMTDLIMPEQEGLETIRTLKRTEPTLRIVAMSGGGRAGAPDFLQMAKGLGADRILLKPFTNDELTTALNDLVGHQPVDIDSTV